MERIEYLEEICKTYSKTETDLKKRYEYLKTIWNMDNNELMEVMLNLKSKNVDIY